MSPCDQYLLIGDLDNEDHRWSIGYFTPNIIFIMRCHGWIMGVNTLLHLNPLRVKFFRSNINIYSHFMSLLHIDMAQTDEIIPHVRQGLTYWRWKELAYQQTCYLLCRTKLIRSPHVKRFNIIECYPTWSNIFQFRLMYLLHYSLLFLQCMRGVF